MTRPWAPCCGGPACGGYWWCCWSGASVRAWGAGKTRGGRGAGVVVGFGLVMQRPHHSPLHDLSCLLPACPLAWMRRATSQRLAICQRPSRQVPRAAAAGRSGQRPKSAAAGCMDAHTDAGAAHPPRRGARRTATGTPSRAPYPDSTAAPLHLYHQQIGQVRGSRKHTHVPAQSGLPPPRSTSHLPAPPVAKTQPRPCLIPQRLLHAAAHNPDHLHQLLRVAISAALRGLRGDAGAAGLRGRARAGRRRARRIFPGGPRPSAPRGPGDLQRQLHAARPRRCTLSPSPPARLHLIHPPRPAHTPSPGVRSRRLSAPPPPLP
jgi:hypothetical protein